MIHRGTPVCFKVSQTVMVDGISLPSRSGSEIIGKVRAGHLNGESDNYTMIVHTDIRQNGRVSWRINLAVHRDSGGNDPAVCRA